MIKEKLQEQIDKCIENQERQVLSEDEAKRIFAAYGIPVVREISVLSEEYVEQACRETGFPLVLKGISQDISHKSDAGFVRLGLSSQEQVKSAMRDMQSVNNGSVDTYLIQPMVEGKREFVVGMVKDPQFGPVIVFGLGGVLTEALNDVVFKIAPLSQTDIEDMFEQISSKSLLGGFRGEKAADRKALRTILAGISDLACEYPDIKEIDINPVIIQPDGKPIAVDGLIVIEKQAEYRRHEPVDLKQLASCYYPKSIAFVGASTTPGKWGYLMTTSTISAGYDGKIFMINPKGGNIYGHPVFQSIADIKEEIDLAVVTIPARSVPDLIPQLAEKKVKGMLLITSGFREVGEEGGALEEKVVAKAKQAGILVLGPNTMGICNPHANFYSTASSAYPLPGSTTLVCQSGNMGTQLLNFAEQQDIGIRVYSGSGNEAMVTVEDYMEAFEKDKLTRTVVLYVESIKDGPRFLTSARRVSKIKPVVVLKGGRTQAGIKAAASHTGAMASDAAIFDAACRQAGIIQVDQPMELLDLSAVFSSLPLPKGKRVAIMTLGGGWGVIAADLCAEYGLEVPQLPSGIIGRLNKILPEYWSHGNPIDIVGEGDPRIPKICMEELMKWDGCDAVIHLGVHGRRVIVENMVRSRAKISQDFNQDQAQAYMEMAGSVEQEYIEHVGKLIKKYEKPVIGVSLLTDDKSKTLYRLEDNLFKGVFFPSPERAVKALSGMVRYAEWKIKH